MNPRNPSGMLGMVKPSTRPLFYDMALDCELRHMFPRCVAASLHFGLIGSAV